MHDRRSSLYHRHRFPPEIIAEAVWLYFRFPLSFRMVEDMLAYRGIIVTHKTVREWAEKFGRDYANTISRRVPRLGDKWHLDEAVVTINGERHFLWRAVDQDGFVLEVLVQKLAIPGLRGVSFGSCCQVRAQFLASWSLISSAHMVPPTARSASRSVIIASIRA